MSLPTSVQIVPGNLVLSGNVHTNDTDNTFCIDRANGIVGIGRGLTSLVTDVDDPHVLQISGEVSATKFHGDGTGITGLTDSKWVEDDNVVNNIYYSLGNVGIGGAASGTNKLKVHGTVEVAGFVGTSGTGAIVVPSGTTAEQPTGVAGMVRFNSTLNRLEVYNGTVWQSISGMSATQSAGSGTTANSGGYKIHTFTSSGSLTVISGGEVEYLVVAGGGGGGYNAGSGGGAGGMLTGTIPFLAPNTYNITVGTGGAGGSSSSAYGTKGNDSSIVGDGSPPTSLVAASGGGYGVDVGNGGSGGSGGGGSDSGNGIASGGSGISGQGNTGGNGLHPGGASRSAGGGGGAGAVGYNSVGEIKAGGGGIGVVSSIRDLGNVYYAGGGGGACHYAAKNATGGSGGTGGGGSGGNSGGPGNGNPGTSGTINTGGGGGGGAGYNYDGASGGSGIVVIRYLA
jgi:hypothetical protein